MPTQSSDPLSSPSEPWSSVSPPPHEVTPLTAVTQATTRTEVLEGEGREGTAEPTWAMHDVIKWWFWLGGTLKVIGDTS